MAQAMTAAQLSAKISGMTYDLGVVQGQVEEARRNYDQAYRNVVTCSDVSMMPHLQKQFGIAAASLTSVEGRLSRLRKEHVLLWGKLVKENMKAQTAGRASR